MASVSEVFVHIGPLKTGTTYIQAVLYQNRTALAEHGVVLPRATFGQHVRSVLDLMGRRMHRDAGGRERAVADCWSTRSPSADAHAGVISMEFLCTALDQGRPAAGRLARAGPGARGLDRPRPHQGAARGLADAAAQQAGADLAGLRSTPCARSAGSRRPQPRPAGCCAAAAPSDSWGPRFWRQQDPRQALAPYLEHVPGRAGARGDRAAVGVAAGAAVGAVQRRRRAGPGGVRHRRPAGEHLARRRRVRGAAPGQRAGRRPDPGRASTTTWSSSSSPARCSSGGPSRSRWCCPRASGTGWPSGPPTRWRSFGGGGFTLHGDLADLAPRTGRRRRRGNPTT